MLSNIIMLSGFKYSLFHLTTLRWTKIAKKMFSKELSLKWRVTISNMSLKYMETEMEKLSNWWCNLDVVPPPNSSYLNSCIKSAGISIQVGHLSGGYSVHVIGSWSHVIIQRQRKKNFLHDITKFFVVIFGFVRIERGAYRVDYVESSSVIVLLLM